MTLLLAGFIPQMVLFAYGPLRLPVRSVHLALSGSSRSGGRRIQPLLGQLAHVVHIPTDSNDF